jgi:biotin carboxylase
MSPSAHLRGGAHAIFSTLNYLSHLKELGIPTVNGFDAYAVEISKVTQVALLRELGLRCPPTRVINHPELAPAAAADLSFPILIKPNIGGSGAGIRKFDGPEDLAAAVDEGSLELGIDHTALLQEVLPAAGGHIVRVEVLDGDYLYAIKVCPEPGSGFNLCPADICQKEDTPAPVELCPAEGAKRGLKLEAYRPPRRVIEEVLAIAKAAHLDVGGIEYLVDDRDGEVYYYDINALSNFVTDAAALLGFDPFESLVDYLTDRVSEAARYS